MSHSSPPSDADRNLLYGVLALQLDFIGRTDLQYALQAWGKDRSRPLGQVLVDSKVLAPRRRLLLDDLVREYLVQHDMDPARGLAAACAPRPTPLDIDGIAASAMRGNLVTLPTSPSTRPGEPVDDLPLTVPGPGAERYRVLRPHARGALGEVFVAHDEELNREVALKEIQSPYANHPDSRARFVLEAEITGSLEHPGIVPVYSLGTHADGRPFYAMRFIKGESLHEAIHHFHDADLPDRDPSERALSLRGLLTRFVGVCNAVAYAHARGVIHRDIKPSNIMLGPYGETLVVDWGLAKAFDQPMTPDSIELPIHPVSSSATQATMLGQAVGTPAFMPPEQAMGRVDQVGPPSDTYALGATLYNLLTGVPAFPGSASEVLRLVKAHQFPPPRRVNRQVPAPLEAIVLRAMAFRPEERYASVNEMAAEIERWLADEPVRAYREPFTERAGRWMRRHRPLVYAATALLLTAVVGLGGGLWAVNSERALTKKQRDVAEENLAFAKDAVEECFVVATREPRLQQERMRAVRKLLLAKALRFYQKMLDNRPNDSSINIEVGHNAFRVALINEEIDTKATAIESYEKARRVFEALARERPGDESLRADLGRVLNNLGTLQRDVGREADALATLEQARKIRDDLAVAHSNEAEFQSELASTWNNLGVLRRDKEQPAEAQKHFSRAREILERLVKKHPDDDRFAMELAATHHNLGQLFAPHDKVAALKEYERALEIRERLAGRNPRKSGYRADVARTLLALGVLLHADVPDRARACYERARTLCETLVTENPEVIEYEVDLAGVLNTIGVNLEKPAQTDEAVKLHRRAIGIFEKLVKQQHDVIDYRLYLAGACLNLGATLRESDRSAEALSWLDKALAEVRAAEQQRRDDTGVRNLERLVLLARGETFVRLRKGTEALKDLNAALKHLQPTDRDYDLVRRSRAFALAVAGDYAQAVREANDLLRSKDEKKGIVFYDMACVSALAARAASLDKGLAPARRAKLIDEYAGKAIDLLTRAQDINLFVEQAPYEQLQADKDLDFLRDREDFKAFMKQLDAQNKKRGK